METRIEERNPNASEDDVRKFIKASKDLFVDTENGEVHEVEHAHNKLESLENVQRSMNKVREAIQANYNPYKQNCYFVTLTMSQFVDIKTFDRYLNSYLKAMKRQFQNQFIYVLFKEASEDGRYHAHLMLALDKSLSFASFGDPLLDRYWKYGSVDVEKLATNEDIINVSFYLANYSHPETNEKVRRKIKGLVYFPPNKHLVKKSKGLSVPKLKRISEEEYIKLIENQTKHCSSTRINAKGKFGRNLYI